MHSSNRAEGSKIFGLLVVCTVDHDSKHIFFLEDTDSNHRCLTKHAITNTGEPDNRAPQGCRNLLYVPYPHLSLMLPAQLISQLSHVLGHEGRWTECSLLADVLRYTVAVTNTMRDTIELFSPQDT